MNRLARSRTTGTPAPLLRRRLSDTFLPVSNPNGHLAGTGRDSACYLRCLNKRNRRKYDQLERDGLLPRMRQLLLKFCVPLWWEVNGHQAHRRSQSPGSRPERLSVDLVTFISWASNASEHSVSFVLDSSTWYWPQGKSMKPQPKLSGASGGPCFRLLDEKPYLELAGFIYEGHVPYELVLIRQASLIAADGTIAAGPIVESRRSR